MKLLRGKKIVSMALILCLVCVSGAVMTGCGAKNKNEVDVYCYGDYMDPSLVKDFEKETGIHVVLDTYDTNEEMYPVIKNQAGVYDVICPDAYMIERMANEGLLAEIDYSKIPNIKNIDKNYLRNASATYDPGNKYSVPYQTGTAGILYNTKKIKKGSITSWNDLWKKKYKGKIIMQDGLRDTMGISLKALGYSLNSTKKSQLSAAANYLIKQKPLVYKYANDSARDLLVGNSADLGVVWNGEMLYSQELNPDLDFVIPKEGTEVFVDSWCIPKNAFHKSNAEKWIDFMCRADVAYKNFQYLTYSTPNTAAKKMLPKSLQNNKGLFPKKEMLKKSETLRDVGPEGDDLYSYYWKIFKSE